MTSPSRAQEQEWSRQNNTAYGGLIAVGLIMVQPFLTTDARDASSKICVMAFAAAIPLLAALLLLGREEAFRGRAQSSRVIYLTKPLAQGLAGVGVIAGFWHIAWFAGLVLVAAVLLALAVHTVGYRSLAQERRPR